MIVIGLLTFVLAVESYVVVFAMSFATLESGPPEEIRTLCLVLIVLVTWGVVVSGMVLAQLIDKRLTHWTRHRARGT